MVTSAPMSGITFWMKSLPTKVNNLGSAFFLLVEQVNTLRKIPDDNLDSSSFWVLRHALAKCPFFHTLDRIFPMQDRAFDYVSDIHNNHNHLQPWYLLVVLE